jgi:hypothetical protein
MMRVDERSSAFTTRAGFIGVHANMGGGWHQRLQRALVPKMQSAYNMQRKSAKPASAKCEHSKIRRGVQQGCTKSVVKA